MRLSNLMIVLALVAGCESDSHGGGVVYLSDGGGAVGQRPSAQSDKPAPGARAELPHPPAGRVEPFVFHLPGVSGTSIVDYTLRDGLKAAGFDGPIEFFDWTCNDPGIPALHNRKRNHEQAQILADKITKQFRARPDQPIYVTCHSGGVGPAVWALEKLPADVKVHSFVMLGPALSPTYDLSKALSHVTDKAYVYWSPADDLVLGTGTKVFGTIDGPRVESAGKVDFEKPEKPLDAKQYEKLVSRKYDDGWARLGNVGGHIGWMATSFVRIVVAPALLGRAPSEKEIQDAMSKARPEMDVQWPKIDLFGGKESEPRSHGDTEKSRGAGK